MEKATEDAGMTRSEVSRQLKINLFRISEIFGYLAYHNLLSDPISPLYVSSFTPKNIIALFEAIPCDEHTYAEVKYKKMKDQYGWNLKMFSYYYAHPEVQLYFINKSSDLKKPLKKHFNLNSRAVQIINDLTLTDTQLSLSQMGAALECSEKTIHSYNITIDIQKAMEKQLTRKRHLEEKELRKIFDKLITEHNDKEILLMRTIYESLGRYREYISDNYPGLINYITALVKEINEKAKSYKLQLLIKQIREAIQKLSESQRDLSVVAVARHLGIKSIHVKGYKLVKDNIKQEIERYSFGQKQVIVMRDELHVNVMI